MFHKNKMPDDLNHIISTLKYTIIALVGVGVAIITATTLQNTMPNGFHMSKSVLAIVIAPIATISAALGIYAELNANGSISKFKLPLFLYETLYFLTGLLTLSMLLFVIQPKLFHNLEQIMTTESTIIVTLIGIQILFIQVYRLMVNDELPVSKGLMSGTLPYNLNLILVLMLNSKPVYPQFDILGNTILLMTIPTIASIMALFIFAINTIGYADDLKSKNNNMSA